MRSISFDQETLRSSLSVLLVTQYPFLYDPERTHRATSDTDCGIPNTGCPGSEFLPRPVYTMYPHMSLMLPTVLHTNPLSHNTLLCTINEINNLHYSPGIVSTSYLTTHSTVKPTALCNLYVAYTIS